MLFKILIVFKKTQQNQSLNQTNNTTSKILSPAIIKKRLNFIVLYNLSFVVETNPCSNGQFLLT